jgi:imidazolonepropionase-like amidohydrolase
MKRVLMTFAVAIVHLTVLPYPAYAQAPEKSVVLFRDARIFDGKAGKLTDGMNVLVEGNKIAKISKAPIGAAGSIVIDAKGRTLMPGLIDAHVHMMFESISLAEASGADIGYVHIAAARAAERQLMRGFTSVRDTGGPAFGLKRAIDEGLAVGPRIYPSGATISQTGGHGDFGAPTDVPRQIGAPLSYPERSNMTIIADGVDQLLLRAREQLRQGAAQLKLHAGGGVSSSYDPLDVAQYSEAEFRAAVQAAENWGTYVTVHAYTPRAIRTAVAAGVKSIEHGQLMDDATAKLLAEKGVWLSLQPFLDDQDAMPFPEGSINRAKQLQMVKGTDNAYALAKKYRVKTAFGTDTLFNAKLATRQGAQLAKLVRWYTPVEVLRMATSTNAELLAMSGLRNPYPGKLGVIEEGALADMLLVNGDPLKDISLIAKPEQNFVLIMKDGKIYKNSVP